jgi:hypothetical protein
VKRVGRDPFLSIDSSSPSQSLVQSPITAFSAALTQLKIPELDNEIIDKSLFPKGLSLFINNLTYKANTIPTDNKSTYDPKTHGSRVSTKSRLSSYLKSNW